MSTSPELTVVIPTKDRPMLLARAVESVVLQGPGIEVIVVDDGSAPEAAASIRSIADDPLVRLVRSDVSSGAPRARNRGLELARGRYWATLDDDDEWLPGKWETQRSSLARFGFAEDVVAMAGIVPVTEKGEGTPVSSTAGGPFRCERLGALFERVRIRAFLNTYVVPTALMRRIGGYDPRLIWGEHTDVLIRLSQVARFVGVDHVGVRVHRAHEADDTRVGRDEALRAEGIRLLLEKHADAFAGSPAILARYEEVLGVTLLRLGRREEAVRTFSRMSGRRGAGVRRLRGVGRIIAAAVGAGAGGGSRARRRLEEPAA
jgi:glycosyltransferase involved in cell wall biosynthesis